MALYSSAIQIQSYESDNLIPSAAHVSGLACALHKLISVTNDVKNLTKPTVSTSKYHFTQNVFTQCFGKIVMSMQNCLKKQQKCFKNATTNLASLIR